ncbi:hypothetical protein LSPH26S_03819 [Lysinibacillus sphaericus]
MSIGAGPTSLVRSGAHAEGQQAASAEVLVDCITRGMSRPSLNTSTLLRGSTRWAVVRQHLLAPGGRRSRGGCRRTACRSTCRNGAGTHPARTHPTARCRGRRGIHVPTPPAPPPANRAGAAPAPGAPAGIRCQRAQPGEAQFARQPDVAGASQLRAQFVAQGGHHLLLPASRIAPTVVGDAAAPRNPVHRDRAIFPRRRRRPSVRSSPALVRRKYTSLTIASNGTSNMIVCSHGPRMWMSISPGAVVEGVISTYFSLSWNRPRKSTKSLLMKRQPRR